MWSAGSTEMGLSQGRLSPSSHLQKLTQIVLQLVVFGQAAEIGGLHAQQIVEVGISDGYHRRPPL